MKKIIYSLASMLILICVVVACSKDQKVVKQLDGKWKVTGQTVDGTSVPASNYDDEVYSFTACKVKKGDCDGSISDGSLSLPFKYSISEKGEKFSMTFNILGVNQTETATITEHSDSKFVISDTEDGKTTVTTLEKI
jgi:hypothetical protein